MKIVIDKKDKIYYGQHFPTRAISQGDTFDDCCKNIREAAELTKEHTLKKTISINPRDRYRQKIDGYEDLYIQRDRV